MVYLPTWMVDFYGKLVGKYTTPMDPMGLGARTLRVSASWVLSPRRLQRWQSKNLISRGPADDWLVT